jgi:hypothetical protein
LLDSPWLGLVKELLDNDKTVMPILESCDLPFFELEMSTIDSRRIET